MTWSNNTIFTITINTMAIGSITSTGNIESFFAYLSDIIC